jgi:hypothetical protein
LYIIKEDAIYQARRVDGQYIYAIERLQGTIGTSAQKGYCEMEGQIAVMTSSDVLVFDGQRQTSITDHRVSKMLTDNLDEQFFGFSQLVYDPSQRKLFASFVGSGNKLTDSLVYDLASNTWSHKKLQHAYGILFGFSQYQNQDALPWDQMNGAAGMTPLWLNATWDEQNDGSWNKSLYSPAERQLLILESDNAGNHWLAMRFPASNKNVDGSVQLCRAGRDGIRLNEQGNLALVKGVWFEARADSPLGSIPRVSLKVGVQDDIGGPIRWAQNRSGIPADTFLVNLHTDNYMDTRIGGRYLCWEIQSEADLSWWLAGIVIDWEPVGER